MGSALPPRRCTDFAVLGLEVFRWSARAHDPKTTPPRLPCPQAPLQSFTPAASLSIPVSAPSSADPFGSAPSRSHGRPPAPRFGHRRQASDDQWPSLRDRTCLPPACRRRPAQPRGSEPSSQGPPIPEVTSEEVAPTRIEGPRSRCEPEGPHRTAPRRCHRPKPEGTAAGLLGSRRQAVAMVERTRGAESVGDTLETMADRRFAEPRSGAHEPAAFPRTDSWETTCDLSRP